MKERVYHAIINDFALNFHMEISDFKEFKGQKIDKVLDDIKALFEQRKDVWVKYLDPSGRGILNYLSEITEIDLNPLATDIEIPPRTNNIQSNVVLQFDKDFVLNDEQPNSKKVQKEDASKKAESNLGKLLGNQNNENNTASAEENQKRFSFYAGFSQVDKDFDLGIIKDVVLADFVPGTKLIEPPRTGKFKKLRQNMLVK